MRLGCPVRGPGSRRLDRGREIKMVRKAPARAAISCGTALSERIVVGGVDVTRELEELLATLRIDPPALEEEASDHAALFARWAILSEEAAAEVRTLRHGRDILVAETDLEARRTLAGIGAKVTEAKVAQEIETNGKVIEATTKLHEAERAASIVGAVREALAQRCGLIVELMRDRRHGVNGAKCSV